MNDTPNERRRPDEPPAAAGGHPAAPVDLSTAKVISDTFFVSFSHILVLFLKPIRGIILGRLLGPALYGMLNIPVPYINILRLFSNIGFNTAVVKLVPAYRQQGRPDLARMILRSSAALTIALGALWSVLMVLAAPWIAERIAHRPDAVNPVRMYALIVPFLSMNAFYVAAYMAVQRGKLQAAITMWHGFVQVCLPIAVVFIDRDVTLVIAALVAAEVVGTALFALYFRRRGLTGFGSVTGPLAQGMRETFGFGRLFFFTDLGWLMIHSVDKLMVQNMLPIEEYGYYAMAALVITALTTITTTGGFAIVPSLSAAREAGNRGLFRKQIDNTARLGFIALVPVVTLIFVLGGDFFSLALPRFIPSVPVIQILSFIGFVLIFSRTAWAVLVTYGKGVVASITYIAVALWNVLWNWILIPRYGIAGAAIATLSAFVLLSFILQIVMRRVSGIWGGMRALLHTMAVSLVFPALWLVVSAAGAGPLARILIVVFLGWPLFAVIAIGARLVRVDDLAKAAAALEPRAKVMHVGLALKLIAVLRALAARIGR